MIQIKTFKELSLDELYAILQLRSEVFVVEQNCVYQDIDKNHHDSYHVMIKQEEELVAYLRIIKHYPLFSDPPSIGRVVIPLSHRKKGYARSIMLYAINYIYTDLKENTIVISAQKYLIQFYESLGFITIGEGYLEDGIPHIIMAHTK